MANKKITQLPASTTPLTGLEIVPVVQSGATVQTSVNSLGPGIGYTPAGTGAVATTVQAKLRESVSVKDFGAVGDGVADDTDELNAAFAYASANKCSVFIPRGLYLFTQLVFPSTGEVYGESTADYAFPGGTSYGTTLMQKQGVNNDAIVFNTVLSGSLERVGPLYLHNFALTKQSGWTDTIGNGISYRKPGDRTIDANYATTAGNVVVSQVYIRGFPENGIYDRRGARPATYLNVYTLFNGQYGFATDGLNGNYGLWFNGFTGDGNINGVIRIAGTPSNQIISFLNIYGEGRTDNPYGNAPTFLYAQPRIIVIGDFGQNCIVNINNVFGNGGTGLSPATAIDAMVYVNCTSSAATPRVVLNAVNALKIGTSAGNGYTLSDVLAAINVPYTVKSGVYSQEDFTTSVIGDGSYVVNGGDGTPTLFNSTTNGYQAIGNLPAFALRSTGAIADQQKWFMRVSTNGQFLLSAVGDSPANATTAFNISRSGFTATTFQLPIAFSAENASVSMTALPTYATNAAAITGGLAVNRVYKTATGELRIVV
jgi:hypothetical protein